VWSGPAGTAPRFSPSGDRLAFLASGSLQLANADGSALHTLAPSLTTCFGQLAWSPDGNWIVADVVPAGQAQPFLQLVNTSLGTVIPLPYSSSWTLPVWR
jgi:Tol biopolymer transport system component